MHVLHVQAAFVTRIIHESTQVEHAANTITVTLAANVELVPGVRITLGGIRTSTRYNLGLINLLGRSASLFQAEPFSKVLYIVTFIPEMY
jgi:hypothetical protein